ncbi:MAG: hypothetical protein U0X93_06305 [Anaerolineales bacterium]
MGLDPNGIRFLLYSQKRGIDFEETAMIGRQSLDLTKTELGNIFQAFGLSVDKNTIESFFRENPGYAESILAFLGAKKIHSFDISPYEGATHLADLNHPIASDLQNSYSVVLDGGSLEHVFNFPVAIKNCMDMLRVGGHYLGITPANNFMGHGFYQFSPEIFFSIFTPQNGFELVDLIAFESKAGAAWYAVKKPEDVKGRVQLVNNSPVYLLVIAKKLANKKIFDTTPQQSDYLATWKEHSRDQNSEDTSGQASGKNALREWAKRRLPFVVKQKIQRMIEGYGFDPRFYTPIDPTKDNPRSRQ